MEKPVKPKRPKKPNKIQTLSATKDTSYALVTDYSKNPPELKLVKQDYNGDYNFNDDHTPTSTIDFPNLVRLLEYYGFDLQQVQIEADNNCNYDGYTVLSITHRQYIDQSLITASQQEAQKRYDEGMAIYSKAMETYPEQIAEYKVKLAEYEVWQANQKLRKVRESQI